MHTFQQQQAAAEAVKRGISVTGYVSVVRERRTYLASLEAALLQPQRSSHPNKITVHNAIADGEYGDWVHLINS